jgi:hypothetical protein
MSDLNPEIIGQLAEAKQAALQGAEDDTLRNLHAIQVKLREPFPDGPWKGLTYESVIALRFLDEDDPTVQEYRRIRVAVDEAVHALGGTWSEEKLEQEATKDWE